MSLQKQQFGWCYFKRGPVGNGGKNHFLPKGKWTSRCGRWIVRPEEQKFIVFVEKSDLRQSKLCTSCVRLLTISEETLNL